MRHAHRTVGFSKIRGVNVNHAEFEDFMFRQPAVTDFRVELVTVRDREALRLLIEVGRGMDDDGVSRDVAAVVRGTFEVRPDVEVLPLGTLARDFEASVKAPRFQDLRR